MWEMLELFDDYVKDTHNTSNKKYIINLNDTFIQKKI